MNGLLKDGERLDDLQRDGMKLIQRPDVFRFGTDSVLLADFSNEIDPWIIERLQAIGCDTAKSVLALSEADIEKRADLEEETVKEVFQILRSEFE